MLIGAGACELPGVPVEIWPWSEDGEVDQLQQCDVGIMPLPDSDFEKGKCGLKLVQYMGCFLPVVASPVGVNSVLVKNGINGFLVSSQADWFYALRNLYKNRDMRLEMGNRGKALTIEKYDLKVYRDEIVRIMCEAAR